MRPTHLPDRQGTLQPRRPAAQGLCTVHQVPLIQREDDKEETIRNRLKEYHEQTEGLISHYRKSGVLREVKGEGDKERIYQEIVAQLKRGRPSV